MGRGSGTWERSSEKDAEVGGSDVKWRADAGARGKVEGTEAGVWARGGEGEEKPGAQEIGKTEATEESRKDGSAPPRKIKQLRTTKKHRITESRG